MPASLYIVCSSVHRWAALQEQEQQQQQQTYADSQIALRLAARRFWCASRNAVPTTTAATATATAAAAAAAATAAAAGVPLLFGSFI